MHPFNFLGLLLLVLQGFGQQSTSPAPGLPSDPREIFAVAAPLYDFTSADLKPWHLKATYQLYDEKGNPGEQGTYEYWWASPMVYRSTWTRPGASHSDWHTADAKHLYFASGERLLYFEYKLQGALLSPLPNAEDLDPEKVNLDKRLFGPKEAKQPCIMLVPHTTASGQMPILPLGLFPTYCFDQQLPALRSISSFGTVTTMFDKVVKVQNRYLAREINFFEGGRKLLSASVDSITHLSPSDAALTPSDDASVFEVKRINVSAGVAAGLIVKKQVPAYPQDAKEARIAGRVVLQATIGTDAESYRAKEIAARFDELHVALLSKTADTTPAEILVAVLEHTNLDDDPRWIAPEAGLSL